MPNKPIPPFLFPSKNKTEQAWMTEQLKAGKIRPIAPRLYTSVPEAQVESAVFQSWADIVAQLFPQALLSHRSALECWRKHTGPHHWILQIIQKFLSILKSIIGFENPTKPS